MTVRQGGAQGRTSGACTATNATPFSRAPRNLLTYPVFGLRSMADGSRSFATPRATPTAPSRTGTVISEKAGHGHPEAARDTDEPVDDAGIPGLLDPIDGLPVQATELAELVLREIALQAETSHAIPDALPLAQDLRIALDGTGPSGVPRPGDVRRGGNVMVSLVVPRVFRPDRCHFGFEGGGSIGMPLNGLSGYAWPPALIAGVLPPTNLRLKRNADVQKGAPHVVQAIQGGRAVEVDRLA